MSSPLRAPRDSASRVCRGYLVVPGVLLLASACGRIGFEPIPQEDAEDRRAGESPTPLSPLDPTHSIDAEAATTDGGTSDQDAPYVTGPSDAGLLPDFTVAWLSLAGGTFAMGSDAAANSQPIHAVTVPDFEMTRAEITVAQFSACMADGTCPPPGSWSAGCYWATEGFEDYPVNCVSHEHAVAFCAWAGGRLPSEAEWEYAARSQGTASTSPWGDAAASCDLAVINEGSDGCGTGAPWPVCSKPAGSTAQGLCDMLGNLFEWTLDGWHESYQGAPTDGSAWEGGNRLVRGGAFSGDAWTASQRGVYFGTTYQNTFLGFRCAR